MRTFAHPWLLWALWAMPVLSVLGWLALRRRQRGLVTLGGLVTGLVLARQRPSRRRGLCLWLGLVLLGVGMAGPRWGRDWTQSAAPGRDLVVVLDLSRSMYAEAPSRAERGRAALLELADALRRRGGHRVALIVFAGKPQLVCPLTHDLDHFAECVRAVDVAVPPADLDAGTRIGAALRLAVETHEGRRARDVVLLSDGDDPARDGEWRGGRDKAQAEGIAVHCVGLGDAVATHRVPLGAGWLTHNGREVRTRLETAPLYDIARQTGGWLSLPNERPLAERYLAHAAGADDEDTPDALPVYRQRQTWFLLPAFILLALSLVLAEYPAPRRPPS